MGCLNGVTAVQIGDGAGHPQDAVVGTRTQTEFLDRVTDQRLGLRIELANFTANPHFRPVDEAMQKRFDDAEKAEPPKKPAPKKEPPLEK